MTILGENSPMRIGLVIALCGAVGVIAFQQGQIQASVPKDGQYVATPVFQATMLGMDAKLGAIDAKLDTRISSLEDKVDLRMQLVEKELARLREDLTRYAEEKRAAQTR